MSREQNNLHRHIEECLVDRDEMDVWIARAQAITLIQVVTEQDWLFHSHLSPEEWLFDCGLKDDEIWDDGDWGDDGFSDDGDWDDLDLDGQDEHLGCELSEADYDEYWELLDLEFGGRYYPAKHVRNARVLCESL